MCQRPHDHDTIFKLKMIRIKLLSETIKILNNFKIEQCHVNSLVLIESTKDMENEKKRSEKETN